MVIRQALILLCIRKCDSWETHHFGGYEGNSAFVNATEFVYISGTGVSCVCVRALACVRV